MESQAWSVVVYGLMRCVLTDLDLDQCLLHKRVRRLSSSIHSLCTYTHYTYTRCWYRMHVLQLQWTLFYKWSLGLETRCREEFIGNFGCFTTAGFEELLTQTIPDIQNTTRYDINQHGDSLLYIGDQWYICKWKTVSKSSQFLFQIPIGWW